MDYVDHWALQGVPTSQSLGWSHDLAMGRWRGFGIGRNTDPAQIQILVDAFYRAMQGETYLRMEAENLLDIRPGFLGHEDFVEFIRGEIELYQYIVDQLGW